MFEDRFDAGRRLAARLIAYRNQRPLVLALPRGGVPVALEIAKALDAPLELLLVRKIGVPRHPELAVAAVIDGHAPHAVVNEAVKQQADVSDVYIAEESARQIEEIERRRRLYNHARPRIDPKGRTAIVVDDGIATGATMRVALRGLRHAKPARLVLAVPVAPADAVETLRQEVDDLVVLFAPQDLGAVGLYYADFGQLEDTDVVELLDRAAAVAQP